MPCRGLELIELKAREKHLVKVQFLQTIDIQIAHSEALSLG